MGIFDLIRDKRCRKAALAFCKNRKPAYYKYMIKKKGEKKW